jgi:hypothetical protein
MVIGLFCVHSYSPSFPKLAFPSLTQAFAVLVTTVFSAKGWLTRISPKRKQRTAEIELMNSMTKHMVLFVGARRSSFQPQGFSLS